MERLFIIGNGFDIAHDLKTKYTDFKNYLHATYPNASYKCGAVPESIMMSDGEEVYDDDDVVGFLVKVISDAGKKGMAWSDLENTIGELDFIEFFDDYNPDEDDNEWHEVYKNETIAYKISNVTRMIKDYFSEWIKTIDTSNTKPKSAFEKLINKDEDLFLTFNYTDTLEKIYHAKNVYHIHGKQGEELIFGHGNSQNWYCKYMDSNIGSENLMFELQNILKKDTNAVIQRYKHIFKQLGSVNAIYSYGFSFSKVDLVYIKEICKVSSTKNITWYLNCYDKSRFNEFRTKIMKCGFRGKFDSFCA